MFWHLVLAIRLPAVVGIPRKEIPPGCNCCLGFFVSSPVARNVGRRGGNRGKRGVGHQDMALTFRLLLIALLLSFAACQATGLGSIAKVSLALFWVMLNNGI